MARRVGLIPAIHVIVGVVMTLVVIVSRPTQGDPTAVLSIAEKTATGAVAYRDFPVEYPPLGLVHIALPRLLGGDSRDAFQDIFSLISIVLTIGTGLAVLWLARRRWSEETSLDAMTMFVGLCLAGAPLVVWRFDILPAFFTAAALVAYAANRPGWTGLSLGLGIASKLYPAFLLPVFAAAHFLERKWHDLVWLVAAAAIVVVAITAETYLAAGKNAFSFLTYQELRGIEIESVTGGIALLAGAFGGPPAVVNFGFGSFQVTSPLLASLEAPQFIFEAAIVVGLLVAGAYSFVRDVREEGSVQRATLVQYSVATLLVVILTNKVLSPQYLVWLLPFVPLMSARKSLLFLAITVMTTVLYPLTFVDLVDVQRGATLLLNARNALLVAMFVWAVVPRRAARHEAHNDAMLDNPPTSPAATPNATSP